MQAIGVFRMRLDEMTVFYIAEALKWGGVAVVGFAIFLIHKVGSEE